MKPATETSLWIGTSWKMNKTLAEASSFAEALRCNTDDSVQTRPLVTTGHPSTNGISGRHVQRFVIPPFTALAQVASILRNSDVMVGAQTMHWADQGAWTGEISAPMLLDAGARLVEVGHSERRQHFGETDETVGLKVSAALRHGLIPLVCVGESAIERDCGRADAVLARQVQAAFRSLRAHTTVLIAYEPVWAIGEGGTPAAAEYVNDRHRHIKEVVAELLGAPVPCLYGGSVTARNCQELIEHEYIDGLFIGRAAWQIEGYLDILDRCSGGRVDD